MIIYKDIISGDEIISDSYDLKDGPCDALWEVDCKKISIGGENFDIGANPSAEEQEEGLDDNTETKIDIEHSFRLVAMPGKPSKKEATSMFKKYAKGVVEGLKAKGKDEQAEKFKATAPAGLKHILGNWDNYDVFMGESMDGNGVLVLMDYREDGVTPYATFWKYAFDEMKV